MAVWRAEALKLLPELQREIASADNVMAAWIEIELAFERAYKQSPRDDLLIARVYAFSDWCFAAPRGPDAGHDPSTAAALCFYEKLPTFGLAWDDMPRWFSVAQVEENKDLFSYHIGDGGYRELLTHISENRHLYKPRGSAPKEK